MRRLEDHELKRRRKGTGGSTAAGYRIHGRNGRVEYEHRLVVERIIGKPLPASAEIHHWDGNKLNNTPSNLVICPNHAYHALLHLRQQAYAATGDPCKRRCVRCHEWDSLENMLPHSRKLDVHVHRACKNQYEKERKQRRLQCSSL